MSRSIFNEPTPIGVFFLRLSSFKFESTINDISTASVFSPAGRSILPVICRSWNSKYGLSRSTNALSENE